MNKIALSHLARTAFAVLASLQLACSVAPLPEAPTAQSRLQSAVAQIETPAVRAAVIAEPAATPVAEPVEDVAVATPELAESPDLVARRMSPDEVTTAHGLEAKRILKSTYHLPMGSEIAYELDGKPYMAKIERHWHEPHVHPLPWGWHRGISLYVMEPAS